MLDKLFRSYLFKHDYLVGEKNNNYLEAAYLLAAKLGVVATGNLSYVSIDAFKDAAEFTGVYVPEPFYTGFPQSVYIIDRSKQLINQLLSYIDTYGLGNFNDPQHAYIEEKLERAAFDEDITPRKVHIVSESFARMLIDEYVHEMLCSSRPLSKEMYELLVKYINEFNYFPDIIKSKNTRVKLLVSFEDVRYLSGLSIKDVPKIVEEIYYNKHCCYNCKKLSFSNKERKFITTIIHTLFIYDRDLLEKRKFWKGLLFAIHFKPISEEEKAFVSDLYNNAAKSVMSEFEHYMSLNLPVEAAQCLSSKSNTEVLRHLDYILSRCIREEQVKDVLIYLNGASPIALLQLYLKYCMYDYNKSPRTFVFKHNNMTISHTETFVEHMFRKTNLNKWVVDCAKQYTYTLLKKCYSNSLGKVYIDEKMSNIALPMNISSNFTGNHTLPSGSIIPLEEGKKFRFFTYWEKVDDIDMSLLGVDDKGKVVKEFSWRTFGRSYSPNETVHSIVYSGDQTAGYNGGSEFFDVDLDRIKVEYENIKYLFVVDNVYSNKPFKDVVCRAGYMTRNIKDSGNVYEAKTVKTSFDVNCASVTAILYIIDIEKRCIIWANEGLSDYNIIAADSFKNMNFLMKLINLTSFLNVYDFISMCATEMVSRPEDANIVVSMEDICVSEGVTVITPFDTEKLIEIMEQVY